MTFVFVRTSPGDYYLASSFLFLVETGFTFVEDAGPQVPAYSISVR